MTTIGMTSLSSLYVACRTELVVSSSLLSNDTRQTSRDLTTAYGRCTAQLTTGEDNGGGREMVLSAVDYTRRSVE